MKRVLPWCCSLVVAGLYLLPLLWMAQASFRPEEAIFQSSPAAWFSPRGWAPSNYADAWRRAALGWGLLNSTLQVSGIVALGLLLNSMAAFAFARLSFPGRDLLFFLVLTLIILPVEVLVVPLFLTVRDLGMTGGYPATMSALILPFAVKAFNIFYLRQHFLNLPGELEEAARVDGAGPLRIYWSIALPAVRPALATVVVLDVLLHWSDFIWPLVVTTRASTRTVQISLANLFTQPPIQWGAILACAMMATLPVMLLFRFAQQHVTATHTDVGIR